MKRLFSWLYQVYAWVFLIPFSLLWSFVCGWVVVIVAACGAQRFASRRLGSLWARVIGLLTPMLVSREGMEHIDPSQTYVVVSNHVSQYDILLVYGWLGLDLRWVMKAELRKLPGIGAACEQVGHIFVDRSNPEAARKAMDEALDHISDGVGILFFPEGTRSRNGRLRPFKTGAFRLAVDQQLPILPLTLLGTRDILPADSLFITPGRAKIVVHEPIYPEGHNARSLLKASRESIAQALPAEFQ